MIKQYLKSSVSRVRVLVDPQLLVGVEELRVQDEGAGYNASFILPQPASLEEAAARLKRVDGNLYGPSFLGAGDLSPFFITLRDEEDRVLPPERSLVTLEMDGAHVTEALSIYESTYNLMALTHADGELGPGEVRVLGLDGNVLGAFPFERSTPPEVELDMASSTADLLKASMESPSGTSHRVVVRPRKSNGELAGAAARAQLNVAGAEIIVPLSLNREGALVAHLLAEPTATELEAQVILDGVELATLSTPLEPTEEALPDVVDQDSMSEPSSQPSSRDDGCGAGSSVSLSWWLVMLGVFLLWRRSMRLS